MDTKFAIRLMYSNAAGVPRDPAKFWDLLRAAGGDEPVGLFAVINNALLFRGFVSSDVHGELESEFVDAQLRGILTAHRKDAETFVTLFNPPAHLLALKLLLGATQACVFAMPLREDGIPAGSMQTLTCTRSGGWPPQFPDLDIAWDGASFVVVWTQLMSAAAVVTMRIKFGGGGGS